MDNYIKAWQLPNMKFHKIHFKDIAALSPEQKRKMDKIVKAAKESHQFYQTFTRNREKGGDGDDEALKVFNKRLFTSHSSVVITKEARKIMARNAEAIEEDKLPEALTKMELRVMKCVVDGLKLIHKGQDHVKDVLSAVVTYETFGAEEYVTQTTDDKDSSCYYVVNGSVEVTYDMNAGKSRSVYQPNILYSHGAGEYIGLVSPEGREDDLSPPATIYTRERSQFIRINRNFFHQLVEKTVYVMSNEKRRFLSSADCYKLSIPREAIEKILDKLTKQEYPSNKVLINQGETSDELFLIVTGRVRLSREVVLPESQKTVKFLVDIQSTGDFFGEECILDGEGSYCEAVTTCPIVCYKLHRSALEIVQKESLRYLLEESRHEYPDDNELFEKGQRSCVWNFYKYREIKTALEEQGKLQYMYVANSKHGPKRAQSTGDIYRENMYRFVENGGKYDKIKIKIRARSAANSSKSGNRQNLLPRSKTVLGMVSSESNNDLNSNTDKGPTINADSPMIQQPNSPVKEKQEPDAKDIVRFLSENTDLSRQLKLAWEEQEKENTGFTKSGVLASMTTEDIVRKAKALAEKQSTKPQSAGTSDDEEEWSTALHEENRNAKLHIAADKYRVTILKRKLHVLSKRHHKVEDRVIASRESSTKGETKPCEAITNLHQSPRTTSVPQSSPRDNISQDKKVTFEDISQLKSSDELTVMVGKVIPETQACSNLDQEKSSSASVDRSINGYDINHNLHTQRPKSCSLKSGNKRQTKPTRSENDSMNDTRNEEKKNRCCENINKHFSSAERTLESMATNKTDYLSRRRNLNGHPDVNLRNGVCKSLLKNSNIHQEQEQNIIGLKVKLISKNGNQENVSHQLESGNSGLSKGGNYKFRTEHPVVHHDEVEFKKAIKVRPSTSIPWKDHSQSNIRIRNDRPKSTSGVRHRSISCLMRRYSARQTSGHIA